MSKGYGWQCESAIIPKSQSRTINNVDSRSLLALKALATSSATNSNKRKAVSEFDLPAKSRAFNNNNNQHIKKNADKDSVSGKSKIKSKEGNNEQDEKESKVYASLLAKAKAYEELVSGRKDSKDIYCNKEDESVIDFDRKREYESVDGTLESRPVHHAPSIADESAQWNWSRGDSRPSTTSAMASKANYITASEAKVKTQWDKVLGSSAKEYLQEIHQTTIAGRDHTAADTAAEGPKDSARERRMQLLKQKQNAAAAAREAADS